MAVIDDLRAFAQSVYLVIKNRYYDDITDEDGQVYVNQVIDWTNQFLDELEGELDASGQSINWRWVRFPGYTLGTVTEGDSSVAVPAEVNNLIANEKRYVLITVGGDVVSRWKVVDPEQINNSRTHNNQEYCAQVGDNIVFSRPFNSKEAGGTITGDITKYITRLSLSNVDALATVKPKQLLVLGVAKNATLPDIVQGGLSPSYVQKFNDLLQGAMARNAASSEADVAEREDFGSVSGVY